MFSTLLARQIKVLAPPGTRQAVEKITIAHSHSGCCFRFMLTGTSATDTMLFFSICRPYANRPRAR